MPRLHCRLLLRSVIYLVVWALSSCLQWIRRFRKTHKEMSIRKTILRGVKNRKKIEEVDKEICRKFGGNSIDYLEVDYRYYQFYNGNQDLEQEIRLDPTLRGLSDMPPEIALKIISEVPVVERQNLRKVSKFFHDMAYHGINHLAITRFPRSLQLHFDMPLHPCLTLPIEHAHEEVLTILKAPGLRLDLLVFNLKKWLSVLDDNAKQMVEEEKKALENVLKSLAKPVHVSSFILLSGNIRDFLTFLPFMKPGVLTELEFYNLQNEIEDCGAIFEELSKMEQFRKAKMIRFAVGNAHTMFEIPVDHFLHFEMIASCPIKQATQLSWVRELVTNSKELDCFDAFCSLNFQEICDNLGSDIEILHENGPNGLAFWRFPDRVFLVGRDTSENGVTCLVIGKCGGLTYPEEPDFYLQALVRAEA